MKTKVGIAIYLTIKSSFQGQGDTFIKETLSNLQKHSSVYIAQQ